MDENQDFSALRNLLALKKLDAPLDARIDQFLIEFHRRQRAQLLVPVSRWSRAVGWLREWISSFELVPAIPYATAFAVIAVIAVIGVSQRVQVTSDDAGQYQLSLDLPSHQSSFAMIPASFGMVTTAASKMDHLIFTPSRSTVPAATRFVLANNSPSAYDASVAF
ncbi:MAG TPA: hypothetical protein VL981_11320 [Candidatus Methylacidiphilales bacterium]|nr:hypothetical protein [Candidatus Methylacidiphilales bacterium]